ncbi:ATP-binding cassette domain-containing protein [Neorhizobium galegae]|uniref:ATP-binding cassette domain-containing protein n=1 Tax=Neorhizobium galegae TaxID=399 RepID=UPI001F3A7A17|nr:ATP-binding cassette domain-containing protein [Neorhizobium galegae]UIK08186.1 ATP-binding cassette domain-containing protein [Neorhizobium galegae]
MELLLTDPQRRLLKLYASLFLFFLAIPVLLLVPISFGQGNAITFPPKVFSFEWYTILVEDPRWGRTAWLSLEVAALATVFATVIGVAAAVGIARVENPALAKFLKIFFIAPMIVPLMVIGVGLYIVFAKLGLLGAIWPLALAHSIVVLPFVVMPVMSRLTSLDPALERASASLGAGQMRTLVFVTLPLLLPAVIAAAVFSFVFSFDEVVLAQLLAGPRFETLPRKIYESLSQNGLDKTITSIASIQLYLVLAFLGIHVLWQRHLKRRLTASPAPGATLVKDQPNTAMSAAPLVSHPGRTSAMKHFSPPAGEAALAAEKHGFGIHFQRLTKFYGSKAVVEDANFSVEPGEFLTVLGPSGSGKTTLLMLIAGFASPDAGRLMLGTRDISLVPPHQRDIGVVFQSYALFPHMTVAQNVAYPLKARRMPKAEQQRLVKWALDRVHMGAYADRRIPQLSGGQQQRIALARAIAFSPRALLMDEPLSALDRNLRIEMQREIRSLQRELGQTVIFVTHDQEEALNMSDRVAVMNEGRIQQVAAPKDLYLTPVNSFVADFFGESNLFRGKADGDRLSLGGRALPLPASRSGQAILCVRPEVVRLDDPDAPDWAFNGTVTDARFLGSLLRIQLQTELGPMVVTRQTDGLTVAPNPGDNRKISWGPAMSHAMAD